LALKIEAFSTVTHDAAHARVAAAARRVASAPRAFARATRHGSLYRSRALVRAASTLTRAPMASNSGACVSVRRAHHVARTRAVRAYRAASRANG